MMIMISPHANSKVILDMSFDKRKTFETFRSTIDKIADECHFSIVGMYPECALLVDALLIVELVE
jgi:hypothetical protein